MSDKIGLDFNKIHFYVVENKKRNPDYLEVNSFVWEKALDSAYEFMSHGDDPETVWTTETYWLALWTAAHLFCKGYRQGHDL